MIISYDEVIEPGLDWEPIVINVDKRTHDVIFENETEHTVTVAIRPKAVQGDADAQE